MRFFWGFIVGIIFCAFFGLVIAYYTIGRRATAEPSNIEAYLANRLKHLRIPEAPPPPDSVGRTEENILDGGDHFNHHCAVCHDLEGDADSALAKAFYPSVADLASETVQNYSDRQLKWIVENGIRFTGMPGWADIVDEDDQWKMVYYMRVLANPEDAKKYEELLKEKGAWKAGVPSEKHEHEEEAEEPAAGEPGHEHEHGQHEETPGHHGGDAGQQETRAPAPPEAGTG